MGAEKIHVFPDDVTGWAALEHELDLIRQRKSTVYTPSMTIGGMAQHWTLTQQREWASNVVDWFCGHGRSQTTIETPLRDLL